MHANSTLMPHPTITSYKHSNKLRRLLQEQNCEVAQKLGTVTLAMFTLHILAFYLGIYLFVTKSDPTMYAGGLVVLVANLVIAGYVVSAFGEEEPELTEEEKRIGDNDASGPWDGAFKQQTD
jgi:hypothetical protein